LIKNLLEGIARYGSFKEKSLQLLVEFAKVIYEYTARNCRELKKEALESTMCPSASYDLGVRRDHNFLVYTEWRL
jgi:hypothetical protein